MRQNFVAQSIQHLKHWLCDMQLGIVVEKNLAHSFDQYWLQELQFLPVSHQFAEHTSWM